MIIFRKDHWIQMFSGMVSLQSSRGSRRQTHPVGGLVRGKAQCPEVGLGYWRVSPAIQTTSSVMTPRPSENCCTEQEILERVQGYSTPWTVAS